MKPQRCKQCWGKGRMVVQNPSCRAKTITLPCDRCNGTAIDPGEHVPMEELPYVDIDVWQHSHPGKKRVMEF